MAEVKMLDTRINPYQEKREPAYKLPVYLAFGISSHIRYCWRTVKRSFEKPKQWLSCSFSLVSGLCFYA